MLSPERLDDLARAIYAACWDRYDRHKRGSIGEARDVRQAWEWLHQEQREMLRDQAARAWAWCRQEAADGR